MFAKVQGFTDRREAKKYATQMLKVGSYRFKYVRFKYVYLKLYYYHSWLKKNLIDDVVSLLLLLLLL